MTIDFFSIWKCVHLEKWNTKITVWNDGVTWKSALCFSSRSRNVQGTDFERKLPHSCLKLYGDCCLDF